MPLSPTSWPGGGSAPTTFELLSGNVVNIANNGQARLTWDVATYTALLDRSVLTLPTVVAAGIYAITVCVTGTGLTANGYFSLTLELDVNGNDQFLRTESRPATAAAQTPIVAVSGTYYLGAGEQIAAVVVNFDGAAARNFAITSALIQRVS